MAKRYVAVYVWGSVDPQTLFTDNLDEAVNWIRTGRGEGFRMEDFGCVIDLEKEEVEYQQASDEDPYDWEGLEEDEDGRFSGVVSDSACQLADDAALGDEAQGPGEGD